MNTGYQKNLSLIAGAMLLLAIPSMWPYAYYQLLRWVVTGVALYNAYGAHLSQKKNWVFLMIGVAILFNPITPFSFNKGVWVAVDVIVAVSMFIFRKKV